MDLPKDQTKIEKADALSRSAFKSRFTDRPQTGIDAQAMGKVNNGMLMETSNNTEDLLSKNLDKFSQRIEENISSIDSKLSNMITLANYEAKLIELMLQNRYFLDRRGQAEYERIKVEAKEITINCLGKLSDTSNLRLQDELAAMQADNAVLCEAVEKGKQNEKKLQDVCEVLRQENQKQSNDIIQLENLLKKYKSLLIWYEKMVRNVPEIRKKNSNMLWSQDWDSALEEYIQSNPKPSIK